MAFTTCMFCWKREATQGFGVGEIRVCKGCTYEIARVISFLEFSGYGISGLPGEPPKPPNSKGKGSKGLRKVKSEENGSGSSPDVGSTSPVLPGEG